MHGENGLPIYHGRRRFLGVKDLVVSFYTQQCQFDCSFCGLKSRSSKYPVSVEDVTRQVDWIFDHYGAEIDTFGELSVGNEGSILDERRFPVPAFNYLLRRANGMKGLKVISLETRPEYITERRMADVIDPSEAEKIDVTIGFETLDDEIRNGVLNKCMDRRMFEERVALLGRLGIRLTSYVMLKPGPTMTEEEGVREAVETIRYLHEICGDSGTELIIYLNPTYVARDSPLASLMRGSGYTPPKIQSVVRTILETKDLATPIYTGLWCENLADPGNEFSGRADYDERFRQAVRKFNETQDVSVFDFIDWGANLLACGKTNNI